MQQNLSFMSNKKQNEELQSRREFFKKAAKAALPVVGAVVLSSLPIRVDAHSSTSCEKQCAGSCGAACTSCWTGCTGCKAACRTSCEGDCRGGCKTGCGRMVNNPGW